MEYRLTENQRKQIDSFLSSFAGASISEIACKLSLTREYVQEYLVSDVDWNAPVTQITIIGDDNDRDSGNQDSGDAVRQGIQAGTGDAGSAAESGGREIEV
jgi:hypothetical protein